MKNVLQALKCHHLHIGNYMEDAEYTMDTPSWNIIINPFKLDGISHVYQLDQSIYVFRVVGISFLFNFLKKLL